MIDDLQMGILSSPILYIPHYDITYVKMALKDIIDKKILTIDKDQICVCNPFVYSQQNESGGVYVSNLDWEFKRQPQGDKSQALDHDIVKCKDGLYAFFDRISKRCVLQDGNKRVFDNGVVYIFENITQKLCEDRIQYALLNYIQKYEEGLLPPETTIIIIDNTPPSVFPTKLDKFIRVIDIPYPFKEDRKKMVEYWFDKETCLNQSQYSELLENMSLTLSGLTFFEVNTILRTISTSMTNGFLTQSCLKFAQEEKKRIVKKSGVLEVIDTNIKLSDVGGLDILRADIENTNAVYFKDLKDSHNAGLSYPKGILIIGMPGCGKSMIAKAIANEFGISLLKLDISNLLGKYYGESEENLRKALQIAEMSSPCVLWVDEVEKAFAGAEGKGSSDALMMRVMGLFLTWQQERDTPIYVVATANDAMRSEFMRKGRFDEVYFVDFPNRTETLAILRQKIKKYLNMNNYYDFSSCQDLISSGREIESAEGIHLIESMCTDGKIKFSGAEIECMVKLSMEGCFKKYKENEEKLRKNNQDSKPEAIRVEYKAFQDQIDTMKDHVMYISCKQAKTSSIQNDTEAYDLTAIDRIYNLKKQYNPKPANKENA